jgi:phosphatidylinositol 4-kinase
MITTAWKVDPAIAVHLSDRFKHPVIDAEVGKWVRSNTRCVVGVPDALKYLVGDQLDSSVHRDLKVEPLNSE